MAQGLRTALVFGPEDTGLTNEEIEVCGRIVTIPTEPDAWSLNLSQAVLLLLYECFKQGVRPEGRYLASTSSEPVTGEEMQLLLGELKQRLLDIGFLSPENPDFFMLPVKRLLDRMELKKNELNLIMGVCRQIGWALSRSSREGGSREGPDSQETSDNDG
jgi:tRNA/rRNA methyltransferase